MLPAQFPRMDLHTGHIQSARTPAAYPKIGVLELHAKVITVAIAPGKGFFLPSSSHLIQGRCLVGPCGGVLVVPGDEYGTPAFSVGVHTSVRFTMGPVSYRNVVDSIGPVEAGAWAEALHRRMTANALLDRNCDSKILFDYLR